MGYVRGKGPVIAQIRDSLEYMSGLRQAVGSVTLTANPTADDTVVISDGVTVQTYKFVAAPAVANDVLIGGTVAATITNLAAAIAINAPAKYDGGVAIRDRVLGVIVVSTGADIVNLINTVAGAAGNVAITKTGSEVYTLVGMVDGADGGTV